MFLEQRKFLTLITFGSMPYIISRSDDSSLRYTLPYRNVIHNVGMLPAKNGHTYMTE